MTPKHRSGRLWEIGLVWLLFGLAAIAVFETYWRLPPGELWKVTGSGFEGGAGRAFVFLSFSAAVAALPVLAIVVDRLDDRRATLAGLVAFLLCATVAIPGVQTPNHLDAKWSNLPAVVGVVLSVALSIWAMRHGRAEHPRTSRAGDRARLLAAAVLLFASAPYIAAELGFFLDGVPVLGRIFQTGKIAPEPGAGYPHATVHHGHHHGLDGFLLGIGGLLLSRLIGTIRRPLLRIVTAAYLSLMLVYGLTNMANDLWVEQVVKRGWTVWQIPDVLQPSASLAWEAMVAVAIVFYFVLFRPATLRPWQGSPMSRRQEAKAAAFAALHEGEPFLIPNPWDAGSARVLEALGFRALATTSSGFAFALGRLDGATTIDEMAAHVAAIDAATSLPVSVDLENGYGAEAEAAAHAIGRAAEAGAVGGSIEDYDPEGRIYELTHAVERVAAAVERSRGLGFPFVLTARAENLIRGNPDLDDTIARLQAYERAGADVLYAPGLRTVEEIRSVCEAVAKPVNVLARPGLTFAAVAEAGAQRVSVGGALTWVAAKALADAATSLRDEGDFDVLSPRVPLEEWFRG